MQRNLIFNVSLLLQYIKKSPHSTKQKARADKTTINLALYLVARPQGVVCGGKIENSLESVATKIICTWCLVSNDTMPFLYIEKHGFSSRGDQTILWAVAARESSASHPTSEIFTLNVYTAWFAHLYTPVTHIDPFHGMKITQLKELELALRQIMLMDHDIIFICHVTSGSSCRFLYNAGDYAQNGNWIACCTVIRVRTSYPQTSRLSLEPWTSWHRPEGLPPS